MGSARNGPWSPDQSPDPDQLLLAPALCQSVPADRLTLGGPPPMTTAITGPAGYQTTTQLAEWAGLPGWRVRRELEYAESAGVVTLARVGRYRLLPDNQLEAFRGWLERRGLVPTTATA